MFIADVKQVGVGGSFMKSEYNLLETVHTTKESVLKRNYISLNYTVYLT